MEARAMPTRTASRPENAAPQRAKREVEASSKRNAVAFSRWATSSMGVSMEEAAKLIGVPSRTLRKWSSDWEQKRLVPVPRGRPPQKPDLDTRNSICAVLDLMGPGVGMPTLQPMFPGVSRSALWDMLSRYRELCARREGRAMYSLEWTRAGAVWAMDHAEPPMPIDGSYVHAFANRDLSSGEQLAWLPVESEDAKTTGDALEALYKEHGPPLVQKADNGSGFVAQTTRDLMEKWGVFLLLSPPGMPRYNGSVEAGIGSMKTRTHHHASRNGRPGEWTCDDLEAARLEANETARPRGAKGPTPDGSWNDRTPVTKDERQAFRRVVTKYERWWRLANGFKRHEELSQRDQDAVMRKAVSSALKEQGYLRMRRRRNYSTTFAARSGRHCM
jgi:transposase InsO family protein